MIEFACPKCKVALNLKNEFYVCENCNGKFSLKNNIPILLIDKMQSFRTIKIGQKTNHIEEN